MGSRIRVHISNYNSGSNSDHEAFFTRETTADDLYIYCRDNLATIHGEKLLTNDVAESIPKSQISIQQLLNQQMTRENGPGPLANITNDIDSTQTLFIGVRDLNSNSNSEMESDSDSEENRDPRTGPIDVERQFAAGVAAPPPYKEAATLVEHIRRVKKWMSFCLFVWLCFCAFIGLAFVICLFVISGQGPKEMGPSAEKSFSSNESRLGWPAPPIGDVDGLRWAQLNYGSHWPDALKALDQKLCDHFEILDKKSEPKTNESQSGKQLSMRWNAVDSLRKSHELLSDLIGYLDRNSQQIQEEYSSIDSLTRLVLYHYLRVTICRDVEADRLRESLSTEERDLAFLEQVRQKWRPQKKSDKRPAPNARLFPQIGGRNRDARVKL